MPHAPRTRLAMSRDAFELLFDEPRRRRLADLAAPADAPALIDNIAAEDPRVLASTEVLITSWGAPRLTAALLDRMPALRAVFHAAGTLRDLESDALWKREILVTSAADANAIPVAEFTFAAIVLANKRAFFHARTIADAPAGWNLAAGASYTNKDRTIGVVGFSRTGRRVIERIRTLDGVRILVSDPYADPAAVTAAGARLVHLDELLSQVDLLTLHAPALPSTHHLIGADELALLRDGAVVINTARGSLVDHDALYDACSSGRLDAVLDVTSPEPLSASSPLHSLPNVTITPHLAGSLGNETQRIADAALDELEAYAHGLAPRRRIVAEDMAVMA